MRFPTLSTYSSTYLLFLDKLVQRSHEPLFCSLWASVAMNDHAQPLVRASNSFGKFSVGNAVNVHFAYQFTCPLCRHPKFPPSVMFQLKNENLCGILNLGKIEVANVHAVQPYTPIVVRYIQPVKPISLNGVNFCVVHK